MNTDAITIKYGTSGVLSTDDFVDDGFTLEDYLCSESQITFGACESAAVEVSIASTAASFVGQTLEVYLGNTLLGKYKVASDERSSDGETRVLTAYDALYDINGKDVTDWYNGIDWTSVTDLEQFRNSFFNYLGITQVSTTLINDEMAVKKTMDTTSCSGATILKAICEINGVLGHINANGQFEYVELSTGTATSVTEDEVLDTTTEDFTVQAFDSVLIRTEDGDVGGQYPTTGGDNQYIITGNFLCYGKESAGLQTIAQNALSKIGSRAYTPYEAELECQGNIPLGSKVSIPTDPATIISYVLQRKLVGIEGLTEYFGAQGTAEYTPDANSTRNQTIATAQRMNKLTTTLDGTISRVEVIEEDYATGTALENTNKTVSEKYSELKQASDGISSRVGVIEKDYATQTALDGVNATVQENYSELSQTATSISSRVETIEGDYATGTELDNAYSEWEQTATSITSRVEKVETATEDNAKNLSDAIIKYDDEIDNLQDQIDGSITTWFYTVEPTTSNAPAKDWTTETLKNQHLGDLYYDTVTGYCYRWQLANKAYSWVKITDTDVTKALNDAAKAQDTADNKRRVFVATPTPPYDIGDMWVQGASGDIMRCAAAKAEGTSYAESDWIKASKYTDDTTANAVNTTVTEFKQDYDKFVLSVANTYETKNDMANYYTKTETNSAITTSADSIKEEVSKTYETKSDMSNYYTKTEADSAITTSADAIKEEVSNTYETKDAMSDYYTKTEADAAITTSADSITASVEKTYQTKAGMSGYATETWVTNKSYITANDSSITSKVEKSDYTGENVASMINQTADSIKISANHLDITGKVTFSDLDSSTQNTINGKADSSSVPTKTSQLTNDSSYTTMAAVETKGYQTGKDVSDAIDSLEIGGRNLALKKYAPDTDSKNEYVAVCDCLNIFDTYGCIEYTISFDAKSDIEGSFSLYATSGSNPKYLFDATTINIGTEWGRYSYTFTPRLNNASYTWARASLYGTYGTGKIIHIKNVKLEKGNKATDWTPAPEDVDTSISTAQTTAETNASKDATAKVKVVTDNIYTSGTTTIEGTKITTGSITADQIKAGTITADQIDTDTLVVGDNIKMGDNATISWANVTSQPTIPSKTSDLTNDSSYTTMTAVEGKGYQTNANVKSTVEGYGYQTNANVKSTVEGYGYQTNANVKSTVEGYGYQNADQVTQITKDTVTSTYIKGLNLEVGNEISMGENATISWSNVTSQPTIPSKTSQLTNDSKYQTDTQVSDTATSAANTAVDNLEIGGTNLLVTSSSYTEDNPYVLTTTAKDGYAYISTLCTRYPVYTGEEYVFQLCTDGEFASAHGSQDSKYVLPWLVGVTSYQSTSPSQHQGLATVNSGYLGDGKWKWTVPSDFNGLYISIRVNNYNTDGTTSVTHKFWNFKLEKGNKPTAWSYAPEDTTTPTQVTQITKDTVTTSFINALKITANDINVVDGNSKTVFNANATTKNVTLGPFTVDNNSIYYSTAASGGSPKVFMNSGSNGTWTIAGHTSNGWSMGVNGKFGVLSNGDAYVDDLYVKTVIGTATRYEMPVCGIRVGTSVIEADQASKVADISSIVTDGSYTSKGSITTSGGSLSFSSSDYNTIVLDCYYNGIYQTMVVPIAALTTTAKKYCVTFASSYLYASIVKGSSGTVTITHSGVGNIQGVYVQK